MIPCHVVEIVTPKKYILNGLWFGPERPERVFIVVHGLGGSAFSGLGRIAPLVGNKTAVLTFSNRGHDRLSRLRKAGGTRPPAHPFGGEASEVFVESADDIEGAIRLARRSGAKRLCLIGHSTGCNKIVHWARKHDSRDVEGVILAGPLSDYAFALRVNGRQKLAKAASYASALIRKGKPHEFLPDAIWAGPYDAQRFLSLYTPESREEIFSYAQPQRDPRTLRSLMIPTLVLLAGRDEYNDRSTTEIAKWFDSHMEAPHRIVIIPRAGHSFKRGERRMASEIKKFIAPLR